MSEEIEAVGAAVTGTAMARAVEGDTGEAAVEGSGDCLNCGSPVSGSYCGNCGQPLHVHRSIGAFWHDILHGVLHFEGKFWRTLPLLAWKPGELTRRYIHGQRARFISPMALFLFSIFMMFAVFSFLGDPFGSEEMSRSLTQPLTAALRNRSNERTSRLQPKPPKLETASPEERVVLEEEILDLKKSRNIMSNFTGEDTPFPEVSLSDGDGQIGNYTAEEVKQIESGIEDIKQGNMS